ncbi:hypothetical protein NDU88_002507 [Pleurodeles waltl]|uniref:Uncharacterized protein n=1 Tax=Pleurodeles waltl TaxID=8319 RepID=A0AAV7SFC2_PLEWA|nr:hypothetical protein NDU88_002507 [Pleurodeles waltl]
MQPLAVPPAVMAPTQGPPVPHGDHRPAGPPSAPAHLGATLSPRSGRDPPAARAAPALPQCVWPAALVRRRSMTPLESPALDEGQAAGSQVRRPGSDPRDRVQTGIRGSPAGPLGHPPQHQHRLPRGQLVIFR